MSSNNWHKRIPVQNPDVAWRMVDDECIIVDPQGSQATVLNPVGSRIWELVDGKRNVGSIVEQILAEYAVDADRADADALGFVDELKKRNLIRFEGEPFAGA